MSDIKDALKAIEEIDKDFESIDDPSDYTYMDHLNDCLYQQVDIIIHCMNNPTS